MGCVCVCVCGGGDEFVIVCVCVCVNLLVSVYYPPKYVSLIRMVLSQRNPGPPCCSVSYITIFIDGVHSVDSYTTSYFP